MAEVQWAPRTVNQEADSLAKGDHTRFNPALRRVIRPAVIEWLVLHWVLEMGRRAEVEHKRFKASGFDPGREVKQARRRKSERLCLTDPWKCHSSRIMGPTVILTVLLPVSLLVLSAPAPHVCSC